MTRLQIEAPCPRCRQPMRASVAWADGMAVVIRCDRLWCRLAEIWRALVQR